MKTKSYLIRTIAGGRNYYYQSKTYNGNEMTTHWTAFIHKAKKFDDAQAVADFKEENPVIKGRVVIYKGVS